MNGYRPLRVSCYAFNALASDGALPLDSVLAEVWMRENHPDILYTDSVNAKENLIEADDLPLARVDNGHGWYYACSFAVARWEREETSYWHKRQDVQEAVRYVGKGRINVSEGRHKAYRMPLFKLLSGERLTWYLVGDRAWIAARLRIVTGLGKKRNLGNGVVLDWQVEEIEHDYSVWGPRGELMRAIPVEDLPPGTPSKILSYGIRPPFWHRANIVRAAVPEMGRVHES